MARILSASPTNPEPSIPIPRGRQIAFTGDRNGVADIWVMDADGSNQVDVTMTPTIEGSASWSPVQ
jgi:Tol biopolymer transport system component